MKSFKVKLKRKVDLQGSLKSGKPMKIHESDYQATYKGGTCKAGVKNDIVLELQIPMTATPGYVP